MVGALVIATSIVRIPSQARARRTRAPLVSAAQREFSRRGYAATTAKLIADRAGVATGTFYQYFPNKDAVLRELASNWLRRLVDLSVGVLETAPAAVRTQDAVLAQTGRRMRAVIRVTLQFLRADRGLWTVFRERRKADPELDALWSAGERTLIARITALLKRWHCEGDHAAMAIVLFGMVDGSVDAHIGDPVVSDERFVQALVAALLRVALPSSRATRGESH